MTICIEVRLNVFTIEDAYGRLEKGCVRNCGLLVQKLGNEKVNLSKMGMRSMKENRNSMNGRVCEYCMGISRNWM